MFKSLTVGFCRRVRPSFSPRYYTAVKNKALVRPFNLSNTRENLYSTCTDKFSCLPRCNTTTHKAPIVWKRFLRTSYSKAVTTMFACAMGLTLIKFYPVALGMYPLSARELASPQRRVRPENQGEYLPSGDIVYRHIQAGHKNLTSFMAPILEPFFVVLRAIHLGIIFSPVIAMAPFLDYFGIQFRKKWIHLVRVTLERAGPTFITWGQWAALRPDLFPRDLCIELSNISNQAPVHDFVHTKTTIENAFGQEISKLFADFDEAPIESGHFSQVHRATLRSRYPGKLVKPVVVDVKVRHPGISESFHTDFLIIQTLTNILNPLSSMKWMRLDERIHHFKNFILLQVDLSVQAADLARFSCYFSGWKDVFFSMPLYPLVHPAILVKTYEKGENLSHYIEDEFKHGTVAKDDLVHAGTRALMAMIKGNGLILAGTGAENIGVLENNKTHCIIFQDIVTTADISRSNRHSLNKLVQACGTRDGVVAAESALSLSQEQNCPNPNAFVEDVKKSFDFWDSEEGGMITPLECMHRLLEKIRCYKVNIDDDVCIAMMSIMNLEGWQRKLLLRSRHRLMQRFHCSQVPSTYPLLGTQWRSERGNRTYNVLD